jgi:hypothetical protein
VVSELCRGFREKCHRAPQWHVSIAWDAAKQWPSEYDLCTMCELRTNRMIDEYRAKYGASCVEYGVVALARLEVLEG